MALQARIDREAWLAAKLNTPLRMAIFLLFVAGMAYVFAFTGDLFYLSPQIAAMIWPANAFQLAVMLLLPRKTWPLLIAAHVAGELLRGFQIHLTPMMAVMFSAADIVTFIIAGLGLDHVFGGIPCLDSFKAFAKYFFIAVMLAPFVSALVGGFGTPGLYWRSCQIWFLLNALAFLIFGPALFGWLKPLPSWIRENVHWKSEGAALFGALALRGLLILFLPWKLSPPALLYSLVPLLVWAALRFGSLGVGSSMVFSAAISCWGAVEGRGPIVGGDRVLSPLSLLLFMLFAVTPFLLLAAIVEERERVRVTQRALGARLINVQEEERKRIARELHDDISQKLALISLEIEKTNQFKAGSNAEMEQLLEEVQKQCTEVALDIHTLSRQLHSANLEYLGIAGAIASLCREFSENYNLAIEFKQRDVPTHLGEDAALCLFRVAQEALNNARRHSGTRRFEVDLIGNEDEVRLAVRDQGAGFDVARARRTGSLGLVSMEERVFLVRGRFSVQSQPGAGTAILAVVPISMASDLFHPEGATEQATELS